MKAKKILVGLMTAAMMTSICGFSAVQAADNTAAEDAGHSKQVKLC